jgi:toxin ParE1/3/4
VRRPARFEVGLTKGAEADVDAIVAFVAAREGAVRAESTVGRIEAAALSLDRHPERGGYPPELLALGMKEFRQVLVGPWRIVYRVIERRVIVVLVADGRRDMRTLLAQRLLVG